MFRSQTLASEETTAQELSRDGIELKRVCLREVTPTTLELICTQHRNIEKLKIVETALSNEDQDRIAAHLTQLKVLQITLLQYDRQNVTFLNGLPDLKHLKIKSSGEYGSRGGFNFFRFDIQAHNLDELYMENFAQSNSHLSWYNWLQDFPNLQILTLTDCVANNWPKFFDQINGLQNLRILELNNVSYRNEGDVKDLALRNPFRLEVLKLNKCNEIPNDVLNRVLVSCSRNVEIFYFLNMGRCNDTVAEAFLRKAQTFGSFALNETPVSPESTLDDIINIMCRTLDIMRNY